MTNFIKKVTTSTLNNQFLSIWSEVWNEKKWTTELFEQAERFLVCTSEGNAIGTYELSPYKEHVVIENAYPFSLDPQMQTKTNSIVYIDKLCIAEAARGDIENIGRMLYGFATYALEHDPQLTFIALMNPRLYVVINRVFKVQITRLGEKKLYEGEVPIAFDFGVNKERILQADWYQKFQQEAIEQTREIDNTAHQTIR